MSYSKLTLDSLFRNTGQLIGQGLIMKEKETSRRELYSLPSEMGLPLVLSSRSPCAVATFDRPSDK